ncbi:hypothetical protein HY229_00645 [Candidatus Acetothermia bacterium]|nr:hypothetical protein [Candidatus Acetothermia bacterium]MBI3642599.1 hypothetical protein [Candidatus Acetothermia bacterium]
MSNQINLWLIAQQRQKESLDFWRNERLARECALPGTDLASQFLHWTGQSMIRCGLWLKRTRDHASAATFQERGVHHV